MKKVLSGICLCMLLVGGAFADVFTSNEYRPTFLASKAKPKKPISEAKKAEEIVNKLLTEWRKGNDGGEHMAEGCDTLFSVAKWEILQSRTFQSESENKDFGVVSVLVDSSTKGGIPIRKKWNFYVDIEKKRVKFIL